MLPSLKVNFEMLPSLDVNRILLAVIVNRTTFVVTILGLLIYAQLYSVYVWVGVRVCERTNIIHKDVTLHTHTHMSD